MCKSILRATICIKFSEKQNCDWKKKNDLTACKNLKTYKKNLGDF